MENAAKRQNAELSDKENVAKQTQAMRVARARQLALRGEQAGYRGTIATSPLGLSGGGAPGKARLGE
jgi:hypothetical protein